MRNVRPPSSATQPVESLSKIKVPERGMQAYLMAVPGASLIIETPPMSSLLLERSSIAKLEGCRTDADRCWFHR